MKSPIETAMRRAIVDSRPRREILEDYADTPGWFDLIHHSRGFLMPVHNVEDQPESLLYGDADPYEPQPWAVLHSDIKTLTYRADFLIHIQTSHSPEWLVIECDGHEFHERTKQQAAYDRQRDREMLSMGVFVIRFTGSEIHNYPSKCGQEVWLLIDAIRRRANEASTAYECGRSAGEKLEAARSANVGVFAGTLSELG